MYAKQCGHKLFELPDHPSQLEMAMCDNNRKGCLCGRCNENTSVYCHSVRYTCGSNELCRFGILIYMVSELLPVTVLFAVILLFNISLTSGALYGIVFYAQTLSVIAFVYLLSQFIPQTQSYKVESHSTGHASWLVQC